MKYSHGVGLIKGEEVIDSCRQSSFHYLHYYLLSLLIILVWFYFYFYESINNLIVNSLLILGLLSFLIIFLVNKSYIIVATNERIIHKKGVLDVEITNVDIDKIQNVKINQGLIQRVFDYGKISLDTSGSSGFEAVLEGVPNLTKWRVLIKSIMEGVY